MNRSADSMRAYPVADVIFHIATANELTHTIPPRRRSFRATRSLITMAWIYVAMFATATGLNTPDLALRFVPTLVVVLSTLNVFCFSRDWLRSGYFGALVVFLVFLAKTSPLFQACCSVKRLTGQ